MILCVGDSVKLGHLREALEQRLHQEVTFLPAAPDIRRQENDILLAAQAPMPSSMIPTPIITTARN